MSGREKVRQHEENTRQHDGRLSLSMRGFVERGKMAGSLCRPFLLRETAALIIFGYVWPDLLSDAELSSGC